MVIVRLLGGLGNQMFQYAAARRLALAHNVPLKLDISWFGHAADRAYALHALNIQEAFATPEEVGELRGPSTRGIPRVLFRLRRRFKIGYDWTWIHERTLSPADPRVFHAGAARSDGDGRISQRAREERRLRIPSASEPGAQRVHAELLSALRGVYRGAARPPAPLRVFGRPRLGRGEPALRVPHDAREHGARSPRPYGSATHERLPASRHRQQQLQLVGRLAQPAPRPAGACPAPLDERRARRRPGRGPDPLDQGEPGLGDDLPAARLHLLVHPRIGAGDAVLEGVPGTPPDGVDPLVTEVSRLYTDGALDVLDADGLASDLSDGVHELCDRDVLGTADVGRPRQRGLGQSMDTLNHVIDIGVGANGRAVTPDLDGGAVAGLGDLAADRGGRLFPPTGPGALGSVAILEPRDPDLHPVLATERERHALGIELFPAVLVVGVRRIRLVLGQLRLTGFHVAVDADGRGEEVPPDGRARGGVDHVDVDQGVVAQDVGLGRVYEAHAAHVRRQLIRFINATRWQRERGVGRTRLPQIEQLEVIRRGG